MDVVFRALGYAVLCLHVAFTGYVLLGGFLAWRWPRAVVPHLVAVAWAGLGLITPVACPLTGLQDRLREHAGQTPLAGGFIDSYLVGPVIPDDRVALARWVAGLLIAGSWLGAYALARRRKRDRTEEAAAVKG